MLVTVRTVHRAYSFFDRRRSTVLTLIRAGVLVCIWTTVAAAQETPATPSRRVASAQAPKAAKPAKPAKPKFTPTATRWELELRVAFGTGGDQATGGKATLPAAGEAFTTNGGSPSRRTTSWYFGDGAALFNQVLGSFGRPERIVPLDDVLTRVAIGRASSAQSLGIRVARTMKPGRAIEVDVDYMPVTYTVLPGVISAIGITSDSFISAFNGLMASGQGAAFLNPALSSQESVLNGAGADVLATGTLVLAPAKPGRIQPYLAVGGGVVVGLGQASTTINGGYAFSLPSGARVNELDNVTVKFGGGLGMVAVAGGGFKWFLQRKSGVRVDARVLYIQNHMNTTVDTSPVVVASLPADAVWSGLTPGIQFSTNPSTNLSSNLTAPALTGFRTFSGTGFSARAVLTVGYFFRF